MRPTIVEVLSQSGWPFLARLVPTAAAVYALIFLALFLLWWRRSRQLGISTDARTEAALLGAIGAVIGARLYFIVEHRQLEIGSWLSLLRQWELGTASWGAYAGGALGVSLALSFRRAPVLGGVDALASTAGLADTIGRWGCFLAGDDFGRVTQFPWGIAYPRGSLAWIAHVNRGWVDTSSDLSLSVHPTQILLSLVGLLTLVVTSSVWYRFGAVPGATLASFLTTYGILRFPIEFLRDPDAGGATRALSASQVACMVIATVGLTMLVWLARSRSSRHVTGGAA